MTDSNRFLHSGHSGRPTRIALAIRGGRLESLSRLRSADSNRFVDSGRPTRIALSIRVGRLETLRRFRSYAWNRFFTFWRLAVLDFRLLRLFGDSLCSTFGLARFFGDSPCSIFGWLVILAARCDRLSTDSSCWRLAVLDFRNFGCGPLQVCCLMTVFFCDSHYIYMFLRKHQGNSRREDLGTAHFFCCTSSFRPGLSARSKPSGGARSCPRPKPPLCVGVSC